ncbi:hypothetical protein [Vibrio splendidus]|uniref:hypothetical protein n=1 Tax=Vibrio splendidus TaxID=29497 RepID=UPI002468E377|nr:hypothetical protein [Vibrio splendidus]MDH6025995.1 hypothetical protein [Vibrio splendidus]
MSDLQKLKNRRAKLRKFKERSHIRSVPKMNEGNRHLQGDADIGALTFADMSQEYSEHIRNFDTSASNEEVKALLKVLDDQIDPMEHILEPVFLSLFDGTMRAFKIGTKQGITASRLYNECKSFSYNTSSNGSLMLDSYTEHLNERENITKYNERADYRKGKLDYGSSDTSQNLNMRDGGKMSAAKKEHFNGESTASDGYGGQNEIYENSTHAKGVDKESQRTEIDHIVPCAEICSNLKKNKGLSDSDIKDIINIEENLTATSFENNRGKGIGKFDKSRDELQKEIDQGYIKEEGDLSNENLEVRKNMVKEMDSAQQAIDTKTNQTVITNFVESEKSFQNRTEKEYRALKAKQGREVDEKELKQHVDEKLKGRKEVRSNISNDAYNSAANQSLGDVIIFMIKPLYYELKDCFINGIEEGVNVNSFKSALSIRVNRIKAFVMKKAGDTLKDGLFSFFKNFLSMLLEGIVNCFVGVFKSIFRMIKEGFKVLMQIAPILQDKSKTMAEKGDAILKLAATSLSIFASIGIESWLNSTGIGEPWSIMISSVLTAVLTSLVLYLLDQLDLFGLKKEARLNRIDEILELRAGKTKEEMFSMVRVLS